MNLDEFHTFDIKDAVKFHKELNPKIFNLDAKMDDEVRKQLLIIAQDFITELGIKQLDIDDITISGSNAAYSYTDHSDLDLHILVDMSKLPNDEIYRELFTAKKTIYNDLHDITVRKIPVELYVQDSKQPHYSLGEYSVLKDKWIRIPTKRRANFDQRETQSKYDKLMDLITIALKSKNVSIVNKTLDILKRYRKAGLEKAGEFGPENLAFKAIRKQGIFQKLWDLKQDLHSKQLSIDEVLDTPAKGISWDTEDPELITGKFTASNNIKYGIDILAPYIGPDELDPHDFFSSEQMTDEFYDRARFVEFEQVTRNYKGKQGIEGTGSAAEVFGIVVNGLLSYIKKYKPSMLYFQAVEPNRQKLYKTISERVIRSLPGWQFIQKGSHFAIYNTKLLKKDKVKEASGYIPSEKEKNDPRFKTALTVDVKPDSIKKNAKAFGFNITRAGIPPMLRASGKTK